MRYYRTRKTAWEIQPGDLLTSDVAGVETFDRVEAVRRFILCGEVRHPNGGLIRYDERTRVAFVYVAGRDLPWEFAADAPFNLMREKAVA